MESNAVSIAPRLAVVMLACREYDAMELALACHMAYGRPDVPFYILQNCRGSYDAERTLEMARRYATLFPETIRVIHNITPGPPYRSVRQLLDSHELRNFDLICKVDDDAFPITQGWLDALVVRWIACDAEHGDRLAYVTPLINNNCWGFAEVLRIMGLEEEYRSSQARTHLVGQPPRIVGPEVIDTGANGTIWACPHLARWLHQRTTLQPDAFSAATRGLNPVPIPSEHRYSIGCILFRRELWNRIYDGGRDDEHMWHMYCAKNQMRIVCERSVPFVHMAYFSQREENRDLLETARAIYEPRLGHPFPIALRQSPLLEIEARLRWMESKAPGGRQSRNAWARGLRSIKRRVDALRKAWHD